jgi:hypothetical protein
MITEKLSLDVPLTGSQLSRRRDKKKWGVKGSNIRVDGMAGAGSHEAVCTRAFIFDGSAWKCMRLRQEMGVHI